jgi:hypothetical protein
MLREKMLSRLCVISKINNLSPLKGEEKFFQMIIKIEITRFFIQCHEKQGLDFFGALPDNICQVSKNYFAVSLRGAKRRSNRVFKGKNEIATPH